MGFFSWLFGKQEVTPAAIANLPGPGTYSLDVVGESNYQTALESICGGRSTRSQEKIVEATLIHEDDNPYDNQAISVSIQGKTVGYLSRKDARKYRKQLKQAGYPGITAKCSAMIVGGWDKGGGDRGHFGVRLDLPTEENSIGVKRGGIGPSPKGAPAMKEEITRVIFRKWPENMGAAAGRIIALFPEIPAGHHPGLHCQKYEQGQHRGVVYAEYISQTRPAAPGEYAALQEELEKIGYRLEVVNRITPAMIEARGRAAKETAWITIPDEVLEKIQGHRPPLAAIIGNLKTATSQDLVRVLEKRLADAYLAGETRLNGLEKYHLMACSEGRAYGF